MSPDSIAATIYQAFTLRLGTRGGPSRDRRPGPGGALARSRRQRVHRPRHLALALAVAPARAVGGGRRGPDRPALGRVRPRCAARRSRRPGGEAWSGSEGWRWGKVHRSSFRTRSARRIRCSAGSSTGGSRSAAARKPSPRWVGTRTTHSRRSGRPAGGWSPIRSARSARAGRLHGPVGSPGERPLRRPASRLARGPDSADGRRGAVAGADARAPG